MMRNTDNSDTKESTTALCPLSVIILTLNEEINIAACLESLSWIDDVILVDSFILPFISDSDFVLFCFLFLKGLETFGNGSEYSKTFWNFAFSLDFFNLFLAVLLPPVFPFFS